MRRAVRDGGKDGGHARERTNRETDKYDSIAPIERTDATVAIYRIESRQPIYKTEFSGLIDSKELWRVLTSLIMSLRPAS